MARYVLPVVGAVVGGIYGGPQGAALGWSIGAAIGGVVDPQELPAVLQEGQRLNDLNVSSSAYGAFIPITWGTTRMAGNIIWALPIIEDKNVETEEVGGKGGPTQDVTTVTYAYFATFALALGEGEADGVIRIWADSKLIYSVYDEGDRNVVEAVDGNVLGVGFDNFTFYPGNETQDPDPLIELDKGDLTPAHRGLAYIVFERLPLQQFGNRIPNITCEVAWSGLNRMGTETFPPTRTTDVGAIRSVVDWDRGRAFELSSGFARYDFADGQPVLATYVDADEITNSADTLTGIDWRAQSYGNVEPISGDLWVPGYDNNGFVSGSVYLQVDPDSLVVKSYVNATFAHSSVNSHYMRPISIVDSLGQPIHYMVYAGIRATSPGFPFTVDIIRMNGGTPLIGAFFDDGDFPENHQPFGTMVAGYVNAIPIPNNDSSFRLYMLAGCMGNTIGSLGDEDTEWFIYRADVAPLINAIMPTSEKIADLSITNMKALFPDLNWYADQAIAQLNEMMWDYGDNSSLMFKYKVKETGTSNYRTFYFKFDVELETFVWGTDGDFSLQVGDNVAGLDDNILATVYNATYKTNTSSNVIEVYDTRTGTLKEEIDYPGTLNGSNFFNSKLGLIWVHTSSAADGRLEALVSVIGATGEPADVQDIVEDISEKVGLSADLFTEETTETVLSYQLTRMSPARQSLTSLATAFSFDIIESDFGLKVVERGAASGLTIDDDDLVSPSEQETFTEQRASEVNLPMRVNVTCQDKDLDYEHRSQFVKRAQNPVKAGFSENALNMAFPMTIEASAAKQIAERLLYTAWSERISYSFQLPQKYLASEPTDVVTVDTSTASFPQRLVQTSIGADFSMDIAGIATDAAQYVSDSTAGSNLGFRPPSLPGTDLTRYFLLDTPLLRDLDDSLRVSDMYYHAAAGYGSGLWPGAQVYKSVDNTSHTPVQQLVNEATWGTVLSTLPDTDYPFTADEDTVLTVTLVTGSLSSITDSQMLSETANSAAIIKTDGTIEIIQFRDVTNTSGNQYELSYILRGRRGTDYATADHDIGDSFVLLNSSTVQPTPLSLDELNAIRYWKAVAFGADANEIASEAHTSLGNTLKPYAPVEVAATTDATDIEITWTRRTRLVGSMQDGTGTVPLNEDSEEYEIDIYDDADMTTLLRTITSISSPSYDYLNADIITDFGLIPSELNVIVYQVSAQVGRGFGILRTIEVI